LANFYILIPIITKAIEKIKLKIGANIKDSVLHSYGLLVFVA